MESNGSRNFEKVKSLRMFRAQSKVLKCKVESRANMKISDCYPSNKLSILKYLAQKFQKYHRVKKGTKREVKAILQFKVIFNNKSSSVDIKVNGQVYNKVHIFR